MTFSWTRKIALVLAVLIGLGAGGLAVAGTASDLQHEVSQSEPHAPPQGGVDCDHCCACHSSAHLYGALDDIVALFSAPAMGSALSAEGAPFLSRFTDTFLRPPRLS